MNKYTKTIYYTIFICSLLMMLAVTGLSLGFTAVSTTTGTLRVTIVSDPALLQLVLIPVVLLAGWRIAKQFQGPIARLESDPRLYRKIRRILLAVLFVVLIFWVLTTRYDQAHDQKLAFDAAAGLHSGNDTLFSRGRYVMRFPNTQSFIYFCYLLTGIFGDHCYVVFELLNCVALVGILYELGRLAEHVGVRPVLRLPIYVLPVLYYPLMLYLAYAYGTYLGFWWILICGRLVREYPEKPSGWKLAGAGLCLGLSVLVRANYLIFLVAFLIEISLQVAKGQKPAARQLPQALKLILVLILCAVLALQGPSLRIRQKLGFTMDSGFSTWSWLVMGISDGECGPGWYTTVPRETFKAVDYDANQQAAILKEIFMERAADLASHPAEAVRFYARKTASMWASDDFGAYWILDYRTPGVKLSGFMTWLNSQQAESAFRGLWSLFQLLVYSGVLYLLFAFRKEKDRLMRHLLAILPALGGFIVHLVWEAQAMYVLVYFLVMLPTALAGLERLSSDLARTPHGVKRRIAQRNDE